MMIPPLISIIVPVYNSELSIETCIRSIENQSYENIEIVVINDGSSDHSLEKMKQMQEKDTRIIVYSQKNMGLVAARKKGIEIAKGDFIGFVDSDDWIEKQMFEKLIDTYMESKADIISSGIIRDYEITGKREIWMDHFDEGLYEDLDHTIYPTMLYDYSVYDFGIYCTLVNKLFKKEILQQIYDDINENVFYGEDCMAFYPCCLKSKKIYILHKAFYHYIIRESSMCHAVNPEILSNIYLLYIELKKVFMRYKNPYILMRQLKKYIFELVIKNNLYKFFDININIYGEWIFHYDMSIFDSEYIIYGAGLCGQALYNWLGVHHKRSNMIAWVDKFPEGKSDICLFPVCGIENINNNQYRFIIIAIQDEQIAIEIKRDLVIRLKVNLESIIWERIENRSVTEKVIF